MKKRITEKLREIEQKEDVKVLYAIESGSRAWGFASPNSDYDVRFIYMRSLAHYLKLERTRDVIEWQLDETLDINGWDIQKTFRLLYASNPTLFEWNNSPIVYKTTEEWGAISSVVDSYFLVRSGVHHYLSMAQSNYREYLKRDIVRLKKYFYVLRPLLACRWILEKESPPPMLFSDLIEAELEKGIKPEIEQLLILKMGSLEMTEGKRIDVINEYIEKELDELKHKAEVLPKVQKRGWRELDERFLRLVTEGNSRQ
jgi:predicted nucleotidyltransferase